MKTEKENSNFTILLKKEFFRKTIHIGSAFVPFFYYYNESLVLIFLLIISIIYFFSEILRLKGIHVPIIFQITELAARERDKENIILGPLTLSIGIFLSFIFFDYRVSVISIYAVAFGDGVASLFGKIIGGLRIPFTGGKTISGSLGCLLTLFFVYLGCNLPPLQAFFLATFVTIIEAFPTGDFDNLLITIFTGVIAARYIF